MNILKPLLYFFIGTHCKMDKDGHITYHDKDGVPLPYAIHRDTGILFSEEEVAEAIRDIRQSYALLKSDSEEIQNIVYMEVE